MPWKPAKPCCHPGCPALTHDRFCPAHAKVTRQRHDQDRGSASSRGYGRTWQRLRRMILARDPVCRTDGCNKASTDVDHKVPRARGGTDHPDNLQGLCHECHSRKTATEDGGFVGRRG